MSAPKHTPEPWRAQECDGMWWIAHSESSGHCIAEFIDESGRGASEADAKRAAACVNYCEGVPEKLLNGRSFDSTLASLDSCMEGYNYVSHQRDVLTAALREIVKNDPHHQSSAGVIARAAIAKAVQLPNGTSVRLIPTYSKTTGDAA